MRVGHICELGINDLQGAACYGDYLFQFTSQDSSNDNCGVLCYNLADSESICFIDLGFNENYHNSHVSFGSVFFAPSDAFPLLYVSENNAKNGFFKILVYRIISDGSAFDLSFIQSISMPEWVFDTKVSYPHAVIDIVNNDLWVEGYSSDGSKNVFAKFHLPIYPDTIIKDGDKPLTYFEIPRHFITDQSFAVDDYKAFQIIGTHKTGRLRVIDLNSYSIIRDVSLSSLGLMSEPEGIFIWNNDLCISFIDGSVYKIYF